MQTSTGLDIQMAGFDFAPVGDHSDDRYLLALKAIIPGALNPATGGVAFPRALPFIRGMQPMSARAP